MTITVRRMELALPEDIDTVFIAGHPEESYVNVGMSLLLPYVEPYLIRTMKEARPRVSDPALAEALHGFVLQEGQHFQQHRRFNELFRDRGYPVLAALEAEIAADYERFSAERPLAFNLAYAEGFEALTAALALIFLGEDRSGWDPRVLALFEWHLVEELEHRTVAFDVYEHVVGSWVNRVRVGLFAQRHLIGFMTRVAEAMIAARPDVIEAHGGPRAHRARMRRLHKRLLLQVLPAMLRSHSPRYSPRALTMPADLAELTARYTTLAVHTKPIG